MDTTFKCFGSPIAFPLPVDGDWVRIQCGVDGSPNYIFGLSGLKAFYEAGSGIYTRENGKPKDSIEYWINWYEKEKQERILISKTISEIKEIINNPHFKRKALF